MPEPAVDFRAALVSLHQAGVRYVIIGGVAMHLHGGNNLTLDLDVAYARDKPNLVALEQVIASQHSRLRGAPPDVPIAIDARFLQNAQNLTLETDIGDFDLLGYISGIDSFEGLSNRALEMDLDVGFPVRVASIEDLIAMKRAANRPKDQLHIMELEALRRLKAAEE